MNYTLSRPIILAFFFTATLYLVCVTSIDYPLSTLLKPIPLYCLIIGVLYSEMRHSSKWLLVGALSFSAVGDIALTLPIALQIELGIGCFLLAHCCYIALFLKNYKPSMAYRIYFLPVLIYASLVLYTIYPYVGDKLIPILIYFFILVLMVFCAFQVKGERCWIMSGALCFMLSDSILSYNLFVQPTADWRIAIMIVYYLAQLLLSIGLVRLSKV